MNARAVSTDKTTRDLVEAAKARGWSVNKKKGHPSLVNNGHKLTFSTTPSDARSTKNFEAAIKRCETGRCNCKGGNPIVLVSNEKTGDPKRSISTMSTKQVAEYFGVTTSRVMHFVGRGDLDPLEKPRRGRETQITLESVERFEQKRAAPPVKKPKSVRPKEKPVQHIPVDETMEAGAKLPLLTTSDFRKMDRIEGMADAIAMAHPEYANFTAELTALFNQMRGE